jgi:hypothetical protein
MIAFAGFVLMHVLGSLLRAVVLRESVFDGLRSPMSWALALGVLFLSTLGLPGMVTGASLLLLVRHLPRPAGLTSEGLPWALLGTVALVVLARPWVPTQWDEFVWLAKSRFESLGFATGVRMALDAEQHLIPPGYPPLWPLAIGWLSLGVDQLDAQVVASSLLGLVCFATALEAWWPLVATSTAPRFFGLALVASVPFVWVHARSLYVDLPVGFLGLAVLGFLVTRRPALACAVAVVVSGIKDEGFPHVVAATAGALVLDRTRPLWPKFSPALLAFMVVATWRWKLRQHGVEVVDHSLHPPALDWFSTLASVLVRHATDVVTWGIFWPVTLAVVLTRTRHRSSLPLRATLLLGLVFIALALLMGPERVRVFAENGTLINRLLLQWWPTAALMVWFEISTLPPATKV